ncbi:MAG TPA: SRPBCC family protein [Dehalococcoidales bacterium]|nr:SRPBCC family protein [Dehalococcoidales bacterium]
MVRVFNNITFLKNISPSKSITREITINASRETVYDFLFKPDNLVKVWPSLLDVSNERLLPSGLYEFNYQYRMGGISLRGTGRHIDAARNSWLTTQITGSADCKFTWTLRNLDKNTRLFLTLEYAIPNAVLKWLAEGSIWAMNEREADVVMNNIKELLDEKPSQSKA